MKNSFNFVNIFKRIGELNWKRNDKQDALRPAGYFPDQIIQLRDDFESQKYPPNYYESALKFERMKVILIHPIPFSKGPLI